ncbi:MAG: phosphoribosylamine--glycine ligase [Pseudomonadota bacterium]|nr:phosphoribosylamine--glycine ligase [Pseudomonadota bacterium]
MNVLVLGAGAREHAIAAALAASPSLDRLFVAPGNPGCESIATRLSVTDSASIIEACRAHDIAFVIVGPEAPLVAGVVDDLAAAGIVAFGPSRSAAQLEGSKGFTKDFCREFGIPTAAYQRFRDRAAALAYIAAESAPIVVKADGLASGKGVVVAATTAQAEAAVLALFDADPDADCVVEVCLEGEEVSFFALCDGERAVPFGHAQDHKRVGEGDTGPNTGGMGAYSPSPLMSAEMTRKVMTEIVQPTLEGMRQRGAPFRGILFAGLMLTKEGPQLLEYNVRFGDPEAEVVLPRFRGDLLHWLWAAASGALPEQEPPFAAEHALAVVMAAKGYPGAPLTGDEIGGLQRASSIQNARIYQAATRRSGEKIIADGGRVLVIVGMAADLQSARDTAYEAVRAIDWPTGFFRRDIGARALNPG